MDVTRRSAALGHHHSDGSCRFSHVHGAFRHRDCYQPCAVVVVGQLSLLSCTTQRATTDFSCAGVLASPCWTRLQALSGGSVSLLPCLSTPSKPDRHGRLPCLSLVDGHGWRCGLWWLGLLEIAQTRGGGSPYQGQGTAGRENRLPYLETRIRFSLPQREGFRLGDRRRPGI